MIKDVKKEIKIAVKGAALLAMEDLSPFQGELKRLERDDYEKLRKNILDNGFSFTVHVWQNKKKNYIIDGHQRLACVKMMNETEGYKVPKLPVSIVEAPNYKSALKKVLAGISQYGTMTKESLTTFIKEHDLDFENIASSFSFPTIDFASIADDMFGKEPGIDTSEVATDTPEMRSSSEGVKQVVLMFDTASHSKFMKMAEEIGKELGTENLTDTVMGVMSEKSKSLKKR